MIRNDSKAVVFENLVKHERSKVIGWLKQKYERFLITECEDIFQEASLELWKKFVSMEGWNGEPMTGMLYRICRNLATHHLQHLPIEVEWDNSFYPEEEEVETDFGFVSPETYRMLKKEQLYGLIDQLAPADRELMQLHLGKVKMKEICKRLKFSSSQVVKNRKCKIVARLRKEINGQVQVTWPFLVYRGLLHDAFAGGEKKVYRKVVSPVSRKRCEGGETTLGKSFFWNTREERLVNRTTWLSRPHDETLSCV